MTRVFPAESPASCRACKRETASDCASTPFVVRGTQHFEKTQLRRMHYAAVTKKMPAVFLAQRVQDRKRRVRADLLQDEIDAGARQQCLEGGAIAASHRVSHRRSRRICEFAAERLLECRRSAHERCRLAQQRIGAPASESGVQVDSEDVIG